LRHLIACTIRLLKAWGKKKSARTSSQMYALEVHGMPGPQHGQPSGECTEPKAAADAQTSLTAVGGWFWPSLRPARQAAYLSGNMHGPQQKKSFGLGF
jgi:hypothetical protein